MREVRQKGFEPLTHGLEGRIQTVSAPAHVRPRPIRRRNRGGCGRSRASTGAQGRHTGGHKLRSEERPATRPDPRGSWTRRYSDPMAAVLTRMIEGRCGSAMRSLMGLERVSMPAPFSDRRCDAFLGPLATTEVSPERRALKREGCDGAAIPSIYAESTLARRLSSVDSAQPTRHDCPATAGLTCRWVLWVALPTRLRSCAPWFASGQFLLACPAGRERRRRDRYSSTVSFLGARARQIRRRGALSRVVSRCGADGQHPCRPHGRTPCQMARSRSSEML